MNLCTIAGCTSRVFGHGLCSKHYQRARRHGDPLAGRPERGAPLAFLEQALNHRSGDCLLWLYAQDSDGRGKLDINGKRRYAAAVICERIYGPAPADKTEAAHSCGIPACVNPHHLRWASRREIAQDAIEHGTTARGERHGVVKLTAEDVLRIRAQQGRSQRNLGREFSVSQSNISLIPSSKTWKWL